MKFEDYIRELAEDDERDNIPAVVAMKYYPFTRECPIDGKVCSSTECPKYRDGKCLSFELSRLEYQFFEAWKGIYFNIHPLDTWFTWRIRRNTFYPDKKGDLHRIGYSIGSDNTIVSWLALVDLGLDSFFSKESYPPTAYFPEKFESLPEIEKLLKSLKKNKEEYEALLLKYHTCIECGEIRNYTNSYGRVTLCESCKEKIVKDYLEMRGISTEDAVRFE